MNEYEFAPGQSVSLTMKQWLELAGVDLDKPFDQQPGNFEGTLEGLTVSDGRAVWFFIPSARPTLPPAVPLHYWRGVGRGK